MFFNTIYFGMVFLRMGTTGLVAQSQDTDSISNITKIMMRGLALAAEITLLVCNFLH